MLLSLRSAETKKHSDLEMAQNKSKNYSIARCIRSYSDLKVWHIKDSKTRPCQFSISTNSTTLSILINSWMKEGEFKFFSYFEWFLFGELMYFPREKLRLLENCFFSMVFFKVFKIKVNLRSPYSLKVFKIQKEIIWKI